MKLYKIINEFWLYKNNPLSITITNQLKYKSFNFFIAVLIITAGNRAKYFLTRFF